MKLLKKLLKWITLLTICLLQNSFAGLTPIQIGDEVYVDYAQYDKEPLKNFYIVKDIKEGPVVSILFPKNRTLYLLDNGKWVHEAYVLKSIQRFNKIRVGAKVNTRKTFSLKYSKETFVVTKIVQNGLLLLDDSFTEHNCYVKLSNVKSQSFSELLGCDGAMSWQIE